MQMVGDAVIASVSRSPRTERRAAALGDMQPLKDFPSENLHLSLSPVSVREPPSQSVSCLSQRTSISVCLLSQSENLHLSLSPVSVREPPSQSVFCLGQRTSISVCLLSRSENLHLSLSPVSVREPPSQSVSCLENECYRLLSCRSPDLKTYRLVNISSDVCIKAPFCFFTGSVETPTIPGSLTDFQHQPSLISNKTLSSHDVSLRALPT
ncbi:hypothetical protein KOW79_022448 [Hemibagrus wyckioides]|uniref:Uncharacterized protein n=1 Tax=Hemibagrus wyckioides TaxID=337641 RepID=A0A9D3N3Z8_9TELE|nr:hypothetical protein KOW79_022448 [Hemibagrus wyckioides]